MLLSKYTLNILLYEVALSIGCSVSHIFRYVLFDQEVGPTYYLAAVSYKCFITLCVCIAFLFVFSAAPVTMSKTS